jgi:LTXXQ motif family protein
MRFQLPDSMARALATATLLSTFVLPGLSRADQGARVDTAPAAAVLADAPTPEASPAPPQTPSKETPSSLSHEDWVETRIQELHQKLKITAAQESQWNNFAEVMRDNAQTVDAVLKERSEKLHTMSAVEDLRSYEKLADAHADGLRKLVPAFETLYNTMSEDQKKTADVVFAKHEKRPQHASSK